MIYQRIILIWTGSQHNGISPFLLHQIKHPLPLLLHLSMKMLLSCSCHINCFQHMILWSSKCLFHILYHLTIAVLILIPVEQRRVKWNLSLFSRIVGISHHDGISLYHGAHGLTGFFRILRRHCCDGRHKYAVHLLLRQIPQMSVHQLGRETNGVGSYR